MKLLRFLMICLLLSLSFIRNGGAQPTGPDTAGGQLRQALEKDRLRRLEQRIKSEKEPVEEEVAEELIPEESGPTVLIKEITVEGATLVEEEELEEILGAFRGKELTLTEIQSVASEITALYRKKGYVTSRAYVPPQPLKEGVLLIRVVEGRLGELTIKGNKYVKTPVLKKYIDSRPDGYFDYSALQQSLVYINEHPDRKAKVILAPGKETGSTDVILEVVDHYPFHVGFQFDNYASRYLDRYRYAVTLEHNNLTGHDDRLFVKAQYSDGLLLGLQQARYIYPVSKTLDLGGYALFSETDLGREFDALDAHGEAQLYGLFGSQVLLATETLELRANFGFDYKDIKNYLLGSESSHDELRIVKGGFDLDFEDPFGRNIFTSELNIGIPDILGAMDAKDNSASRAGAGGKFQKGVFNYFRLQPMPYESHILLKNSAQFTNHALVAAEQFQIGGPTSVRGYAPAEFSGDKGIYSAVEWSFPVYGLSKEFKVPFRQEKLYDALRIVAFYDIGFVNIKNVGAGETENQTLKAYGFGTRLNVSDDLALRVEVGFPIGDNSADGDHAHTWVECEVKF